MLDLRKNLIERRMIELDPLTAEHYLKFNVYETQRPLRPEHVNELADKMSSGLFRFGEVAFGRIVLNGKTIDLMLNGQHVCEGAVKSGVTIPCVLERFRIKTERELSEAFRQFEILPRSLRDMVRVEAYSLKLKWPLWISSLVVAAAALEKTATKRVSCAPGIGGECSGKGALSREAKVRLLKDYLEEGEFLNRLLTLNSTSTRKRVVSHLNRQAVALIIMKTCRIDSTGAKAFWVRVRDGENLTAVMPEMKLREFLKAASSLDRRVTNHEYAYRCAVAWNAHRTKKATNLAYHASHPVPKLK